MLTRHSGSQLPGSAVGHMDNGRGSLIHHHLILVPQAALNEVKQGAVMTESVKTENTAVNNLHVSRCTCVSLQEITAGLLTLPPSRPAVCWRSWWACSRQRETWDQIWWTCWASWWQQDGRSSWGDTTGPRHGTGRQDNFFNRSVWPGLEFVLWVLLVCLYKNPVGPPVYTHNRWFTITWISKSLCSLYYPPGPWCCHWKRPPELHSPIASPHRSSSSPYAEHTQRERTSSPNSNDMI